MALAVVRRSSGLVWTMAARVRAGFLVRDFSGIGVDRRHLYRHGQFLQIAVVENAAARRDFEGALLLSGGALHIRVVAHNHEPEHAGADGQHPKEEESADEPEPPAIQGNDARGINTAADGSNGCLHGNSAFSS
jgi:hypothetical protein